MKYWVLTVIGVLTATFISIYALHQSSYCIGEARFVSNEEMIEAAIDNEVTVINAYASNNIGPNVGEKYLPFTNADQFRKLNPGCCNIIAGDPKLNALHFYNLWDGVFGYYAVVVGLEYKARYLDQSGVERERAVLSTIPVSSCGRIEVEVYRGV